MKYKDLVQIPIMPSAFKQIVNGELRYISMSRDLDVEPKFRLVQWQEILLVNEENPKITQLAQVTHISAVQMVSSRPVRLMSIRTPASDPSAGILRALELLTRPASHSEANTALVVFQNELLKHFVKSFKTRLNAFEKTIAASAIKAGTEAILGYVLAAAKDCAPKASVNGENN